MATYKLTYFPCKALGELVRLVFVQAGVEYENNRLGFFPFGSAEWSSMKKTLPTVGQTLPILEVDGKTLSGHVCISRYLAEKFGLAGRRVRRMQSWLVLLTQWLTAGVQYYWPTSNRRTKS
ncbi:Glutathione S-transferase 1 [Geodia barretti]|uniref:Glutathione S-transferase 1 n=1 Tax=Geodia barretti TaxID=519541 RepID=A0AA35X0Q9_GEOBA|nr:Glutathione S-transferase 1 [Geodia barretti]